MSNYSNTKATIAANVYTNHNNEVTAEMVKAGINAVVDTLIAGGFIYKGVATTSTNPGSPDANVFYIATAPGTYTNFGSLVVADGEVAILKYNGSWSKEVTGAATAAEVTALGQKVGILNLVNLLDSGISLEQGSITTTGADGASANAVRTSFPVNTGKGFTIAVPSGYNINRVLYYSAYTDNDNFTLGAYEAPAAQRYEVKTTYPLVRFMIGAGGTAFTPDLFLQNLLLTTPKLDEIRRSIFGNLAFGNAGYINANTGAFVSVNSWRSTDYIPVNPGDTFSIYSKANGSVDAAFYDENKNFISSLAGTTGTKTITAPSAARYMRCSNEVSQARQEPYVRPNVVIYEQIVKALNKPEEIRLFDSVKKPIDFNGKVLGAFGDSITAGVASPGLINAGDNKYISLFCSRTGATLLNNAQSGATLTTGHSGLPSICDAVLAASTHRDIIWIAGGINDWQEEAPIGTFTSTDTTTVYGALNAICSYIKTTWPNADVIFVTPIPTTSLTVFGQTHPDNLDEYRKAIQEVAAENGFNVVNGDGLGLPNEMTPFGNTMFDPSDKLHPTLAGHAMYFRSLCGKLL